MAKSDAVPALAESTGAWQEANGAFRFVLSELKPKGQLLTPFNIVTVPIIVTGLTLIVIRFAFGLSSVTNLSQAYPWGIWIGFDVVTQHVRCHGHRHRRPPRLLQP